jgi:hypothetical protein
VGVEGALISTRIVHLTQKEATVTVILIDRCPEDHACQYQNSPGKRLSGSESREKKSGVSDTDNQGSIFAAIVTA